MNCIAEEVYLKINYDSKNDLYYWKLEKYLNRNECIDKFIKENFFDYLLTKRKSKFSSKKKKERKGKSKLKFEI